MTYRTKATTADQINPGDRILWQGRVLTVTQVRLGAEKDWVHVTGDPATKMICLFLEDLEVIQEEAPDLVTAADPAGHWELTKAYGWN